MDDIIILQQIADTVVLYANCVKKGFHTIQYFKNPEQIITITTDTPKVTLHDLDTGTYYLYAENQNQEQTGHLSFTVSGLQKETVFKNIAADNRLNIEASVCSALSADQYIIDLYKNMLRGKAVTEELLMAFIQFYNSWQETLNTNGLSEFTFSDQTISSQTKIAYQFVPYIYDFAADTWNIIRDQIEQKTESYSFFAKPRFLCQISVLSDFNVVRKYYIYQPSETLSETILERRLQTKQNKNEILQEKILQINLETIEEDEVGQNIVAALLYFKPDHTVFRIPEITINETTLHFFVPDYECISLLEQPVYLAILEIEEIFSASPHPHRYQIKKQQDSFALSSLLLNSDTEYICYLADENDTKLSDLVLISLNPEYPVELYTKAYKRTVYDEYVRKLYTVFKEYGIAQWDTVSSLLSQYLLCDDLTISLYEFMWQQILHLDPVTNAIDQMLKLIVLCQLQNYMDIDQSFVREQVYAVPYKKHVFPVQDPVYIIHATYVNGDTISHQYYLSGNSGTEIWIDRADIVLLQAVDPETWKSSSIAYYNNRYNGARYFYFPKLEVTVDGRLS